MINRQTLGQCVFDRVAVTKPATVMPTHAVIGSGVQWGRHFSVKKRPDHNLPHTSNPELITVVVDKNFGDSRYVQFLTWSGDQIGDIRPHRS